jgi:tetratricopeptide (TPR) repeat protein
MTSAPLSKAQVSDLEKLEGEISGTVLLETNKRPASQVIVSLRSRVAGIFRSVLTDLEGHFRVQHLPRGAYEIDVEEQGYESTQASAQLDGASSKLVMYLKSRPSSIRSRDYTISVRQLKISGKAWAEFEKGTERLRKDDPAGSLQHFTKAVEEFPGYFEAYYHRGVAEMRLSRKDDAMRDFQAAIDLSGGRYARAQFGIGNILCQQGRPAEAEKVTRRGLEVDDTEAEGHAILAIALMELHRPEEAEKSAQLRALDAYLTVAPHGPASDVVRRAREEVLARLAQAHPVD